MRTYKWKPEVSDHRDRTFSLKMKATLLPAFVDPIGGNDPVEDQGQIGSCTGNSSTTALEISLKTTTQYSRLMAYYNGRWLENNVRRDDGAQIRDVIKGIQKFGVSTEEAWPYDVTKFAKKAPAKAYKEARAVIPLIESYERLITLTNVKTALASGLGVVFGFAVPEFFEGPEVAQTGWARMPTATDKMVGGHAVCAIGYDERNLDGKGSFVWVRNSWGKGWGLQGNFKMPYEWFTSPARLVDDMWCMHPKKS